MKIINIDNKDYKFEYTLEASLYKDCADAMFNMLADEAIAENEQDLKKYLSSVTNVPSTALTIFYAGLLEHHSDEITCIEDAKVLLKKYFSEGGANGNFYDLFAELAEMMGNDGFFELVGLDKVFNTQTETTKVPQDHKKKTTKKTVKATEN